MNNQELRRPVEITTFDRQIQRERKAKGIIEKHQKRD